MSSPYLKVEPSYNETIGISENTRNDLEWFTHYAMFVLFDTPYDGIDYYVVVNFDLENVLLVPGMDLSPYVVGMSMAYGWHYGPGDVAIYGNVTILNYFRGQMIYGDTENTDYITFSKGSYFATKFNALFVLDLYNGTFEYLADEKPRFDYVDGDFAISDVGDMIYDLFYKYPSWIINHVVMPFKIFGVFLNGDFNSFNNLLCSLAYN